MPKITDEPLQNIQATLFKSDMDYLRSLFKGHVGVNKVIRTVVRSYVNQIKAQAAKEIDEAEGQKLGDEHLL